MGIDQYFTDIIETHINNKLSQKLSDAGLFLWHNVIKGEGYTVSDVCKNSTNEKRITIYPSIFVSNRWRSLPIHIVITEKRITLIDGVDEILINNKEDWFYVTLEQNVYFNYETLILLQSFFKKMVNMFENDITIYYGLEEEKQYGY